MVDASRTSHLKPPLLFSAPQTASSSIDDKFTIVTMTYSKRLPCLHKFVPHYSTCPSGEVRALTAHITDAAPPPVMLCMAPCAGSQPLFTVQSPQAQLLANRLSHLSTLTTPAQISFPLTTQYAQPFAAAAAVAEIVLVWDEEPLDLGKEFPGARVRTRHVERMSLSNRFGLDPLTATRAVLTLDDDLILR